MSDSTARRVVPALVVCVIWGINFSAITQAEEVFPPMLLAFLRFFLCAFPVIIIVRRPNVPALWIVWYGVLFGVLQFAFLFVGMKEGVTSGAAAFLLQSQVFFTVLLSFLVMSERIKRYQSVGLIVGFLGIAIVLLGGAGNVSVLGGLLVIAAGISWGGANIIVKRARPDNVFSFIVYASAVATVPFLFLTVVVDGGEVISAAFREASWGAYLSLAYLVYPTTLLGYWVWNKLLKEYPAVKVAPFALLVPIVGVIGSAVWHRETASLIECVGFVAILLGLAVCQFWPLVHDKLIHRPKEI